MSSLDQRLDKIENRANPPKVLPYCIWWENADGSDSHREPDSLKCAMGLDDPTTDDCARCPANRLTVVIIASKEDIEIVHAREVARKE